MQKAILIMSAIFLFSGFSLIGSNVFAAAQKDKQVKTQTARAPAPVELKDEDVIAKFKEGKNTGRPSYFHISGQKR